MINENNKIYFLLTFEVFIDYFNDEPSGRNRGDKRH